MRWLRIVFACAALGLPGVARAQQVSINWRTDLPQTGLAEARALGRCALIYFTNGSEACRRLEREAFADAGVVVAMKEFVTIRADTRSPQAHAALQQRLGVTRYPTVIFFDPTGNAVDRLASTRTDAVRGQLLRVLRERWRPDAAERPAGDSPRAARERAPSAPRRDPTDPGSLDEWVNKGGWIQRLLQGLLVGLLPLLIALLRGHSSLGWGLGLLGSGVGCALGGLPGALGVAGATVVLSTTPRQIGLRATSGNLLVGVLGLGLIGWTAAGVLRPELLPAEVRPVGAPELSRSFRATYQEWDRLLEAGDPDGALAVVDEFELLGGAEGHQGDVAGMRKLALKRGARDPGQRGARWIVERTLLRRYEEGRLWRDALPPLAGLIFLFSALLGLRGQRQLLAERTTPWAGEESRGTPRRPGAAEQDEGGPRVEY